jgi:hypothetical protein
MNISYHYQTDVVRLVINYLQKHPDSEDTVEGITQWWVKQQQFADSFSAVDNALKILSIQGEISAVKRDHQTYYRLIKKLEV